MKYLGIIFILGIIIASFFAGSYTKQREYDKDKQQSDSLYNASLARQKATALERDSLFLIINSIDSARKVTRDSLKASLIREKEIPKKFKSLTSKQLEDLMIREFEQNK